MVFQKSMVNWRREGWGLSALVEWAFIDLLLIGEEGGVNLPWVYVHSAIYDTYLKRYMCMLLYVKLLWCSGLPTMYGQLGGGVGSVCTGICAFFYMGNIVMDNVALQKIGLNVLVLPGLSLHFAALLDVTRSHRYLDASFLLILNINNSILK